MSRAEVDRARYERAYNNEDLWAIRVLTRIKHRAAQTGVPFNLTAGYLMLLAEPAGLFNVVCDACGRTCKRSDGKLSNVSPTLDRICPEFGYVKGNVRWVCLECNRIKGGETLEQRLTTAALQARVRGGMLRRLLSEKGGLYEDGHDE